MKPRLLSLLAAVSLFGLMPRGVDAHPNARFYRGDVTVSTSWEGVIRLTGKLVIREGVTVTVEPGTEVLVQPGAGNDIEVRGRLLVRGIPEKPVLFDTAGGCSAGPWGGIRFRAGSAGVFEHVRVRCAGGGLSGDLAGVTRVGLVVEAGR
ncbi:MAG: hypothetical protein WC899_03485 [bacterium]|jgi:hypothetical protein